MSIIVPKRAYINYEQRVVDDNNPKLGFATDADKEDKAFLKRKDTIDSWAQRYLWRYERSEDGKSTRHIKDDPIHEAEYLDNAPRSGFKIPRHVRRWGWNGGNVVWRIEDPRGFELEIPSENLGQLLMHCTIVNGEIQEECVWGWNKTGGSRVVLLPANSEPYAEAMKDTKRHTNKVSLKDVNIGDRVVLKNGAEGIFYGGHYIWFTEHLPSLRSSWGYHSSMMASRVDVPLNDDGATGPSYEGKIVKSVRRHFLKLDDGNWYIQSGFKVSTIEEKCEDPLTDDQALAKIQESLVDGGTVKETFEPTDWSYQYGVAILGVGAKNDTGSIELVPVTIDEIKKYVNGKNNPYSVPVIFPYENDLILDRVDDDNFRDGGRGYSNYGSHWFLKDFLERDIIMIKHRRTAGHYGNKNEDPLLNFKQDAVRQHYLIGYRFNGQLTIIQ